MYKCNLHRAVISKGEAHGKRSPTSIMTPAYARVGWFHLIAEQEEHLGQRLTKVNQFYLIIMMAKSDYTGAH